jgi:hypothetical protein
MVFFHQPRVSSQNFSSPRNKLINKKCVKCYGPLFYTFNFVTTPNDELGEKYDAKEISKFKA